MPAIAEFLAGLRRREATQGQSSQYVGTVSAVGGWAIDRRRRFALLGVACLLAFGFANSSAAAQDRGEVQVTARVLPLPLSGEAILRLARAETRSGSAGLFHVHRLQLPQVDSLARVGRRKVVVVVEFLAN